METTPGKRLRHIRELLGYQDRQNDFAEELGMSQQSLSNMERDKGKPSFDSLQKIVEAFPGVSLGYILTGQGDPIGRALTPALSQAAAPAASVSLSRPAPLQTEPGQVDFVAKYISRMEADLEAARKDLQAERDASAAREAYYQARLQELVGKSLGSLTIAATDAPKQETQPEQPKQEEKKQEAFKRPAPIEGFVVRQMYPDGVAGEVTPRKVANL
ncbi:helix-turn-helix domain-containing protein [Hymenobacter psychrophilus]|uniref:Transcriptional regulator, contains XRE-family HTH domain n=1 Tax=Hymenobacter psychrophilus TaxID=651662 RepID=A0A1H3PKW2_9BACT|nr:helix-turn-helix transcriptional regulator [Hymenobacter psychrophilus]SDZ01842.1 Transcriptional regulator, contains XRE-family HTH domain [Hymenobacter psychrophilus]